MSYNGNLNQCICASQGYPTPQLQSADVCQICHLQMGSWLGRAEGLYEPLSGTSILVCRLPTAAREPPACKCTPSLVRPVACTGMGELLHHVAAGMGKDSMHAHPLAAAASKPGACPSHDVGVATLCTASCQSTMRPLYLRARPRSSTSWRSSWRALPSACARACRGKQTHVTLSPATMSLMCALAC